MFDHERTQNITAQEYEDGLKFELYDDETDLDLPQRGWVRIVLDYPKSRTPMFNMDRHREVLITDPDGFPMGGRFVKAVMHKADREMGNQE